MGHAHHHFEHAQARRLIDDRVERRDERLATLDREALLTKEPGVDEALQHLGLIEFHQHAALLAGIETRLVAPRLDALAHPGLHLAILDVRVFDPDGAAVGGAQVVDDHRQLGAPAQASDRIAGEFVVEVGWSKAMAGQFELRIARLVVEAERIEGANGVADAAVGVDQGIGALLVSAVGRALGAGGGRCWRSAGEGEFEAGEEVLPIVGHAGGVCAPLLVEPVDELGVGGGGEVGGLDHGCSTQEVLGARGPWA